MTTSSSSSDNGAGAALLTTLLTNAIVCVVVLGLFSVFRRRYAEVYACRATKPSSPDSPIPPTLPDGLLSWVKPVLTMPRDQVLRFAGIDGYMFIRFLSFGAKLFAALTIVGCLAIVPLNLSTDKSSGFNRTSMSAIDADHRKLLWVHWLSVYLFSAATIVFLRSVAQEYVHLRHSHFLKNTLSARTLMVTGLEADCNSHTALWEGFSNLFPNQLQGVALAFDGSEASDKKEDREKVVRSLETATVKWADAQAEDPTAAPASLRPTHKINKKCFCVGGAEVDSIEQYTTDLAEATTDLATAREGVLPLSSTTDPSKATSGGFVTFRTNLSAHHAAQAMHFTSPDTQLSLAPEPRDIVWDNLGMAETSKIIRQPIVSAAVYALVFFWSIPVAFLSGLANIKAMSHNTGFHWLKPLANANPAIVGFVSGLAPVVLLSLFMSLLPGFLMRLTKAEGVASISGLHRGVVTKFYLFQIFNVFLVTTIAGSVFGSLKQITSHPTSIMSLLASSLPAVASFFVGYIILQTLSSLALHLLRIGPLIVTQIKLKFLAVTPRDIDDVYKDCAGTMNWGAVVPLTLLVLAVGLTYSTINPVICPAACLFFCMSSLVWRYNLVYVFDRPFQSGGLFFPIMWRRTLVGLFIYQFTLIGLFTLHKAPSQASTLLPLPVLTSIAWMYIHRNYEALGEWLPTEVEKASSLRGMATPSVSTPRSSSAAAAAASSPSPSATMPLLADAYGVGGGTSLSIQAAGSGAGGAAVRLDKTSGGDIAMSDDHIPIVLPFVEPCFRTDKDMAVQGDGEADEEGGGGGGSGGGAGAGAGNTA